jgi:hypothetical protein
MSIMAIEKWYKSNEYTKEDVKCCDNCAEFCLYKEVFKGMTGSEGLYYCKIIYSESYAPLRGEPYRYCKRWREREEED